MMTSFGDQIPSQLVTKYIDRLIGQFYKILPIKESGEVYYPGELALHTMIENKELGIPVVEEIWEEVLHM